MTDRIIGPVLIGTIAMLVDAGGQLVNHLVENHWMGLPTALTVAASVGAFVWWIDGRFERNLEQRIRQDEIINHRLAKIEQRLDDLPCDEECYNRKKKKT